MNQIDIIPVPGSLPFQLEHDYWLGYTMCESCLLHQWPVLSPNNLILEMKLLLWWYHPQVSLRVSPCVPAHCSRSSSIPEVVCIFAIYLSPSLHLWLSFSHHLTSLKPPSCGNFPVPMATFTFRITGLMLGPGSGGRKRNSSLLFSLFLAGQEKQ